MEIYLTKVCSRWVQKNNVELASQLSHGILRINTTTLLIDSRHYCEEIYIYIYIYRSIRESLQDLEVVHSRHKKFFHESLQDLEVVHNRGKKFLLSNYFKLNLQLWTK